MSLSITSTRLLNTSKDGDFTTSLGSLFERLITLDNPFSEEILPNIQRKSPLVQPEAICYTVIVVF